MGEGVDLIQFLFGACDWNSKIGTLTNRTRRVDSKGGLEGCALAAAAKRLGSEVEPQDSVQS